MRLSDDRAGQKLTSPECPLLADCVEKLENRETPKISKM